MAGVEHSEQLELEVCDLLDRFPKRVLSDRDLLVLKAAQMLNVSASTAVDIVRGEMSTLLGDPDCDDAYLIAAGWLLALRPATAEQVRRDTLGRFGELPVKGSLSQAAGENTKSFRRHIAFYCLKNRTDHWSAQTSRSPRNIFDSKNGRPSPRTLQIAGAVHTSMLKQLSQLPKTITTTASAPIVRPAGITYTAPFPENEEAPHSPSTPTHLASHGGRSPMGMPRLLAPQGNTYRRWEMQPDRYLFRRTDLFSDRKPKAEELFLYFEAVERPVSVNTLFMSARIRLLMERFDKVSRWDSGYGPLPLLEAIQSRMEELLHDATPNLPRTISLAQAAHLGRMILDPRPYKSPSIKDMTRARSGASSGGAAEEWRIDDIVRNFNRWIVDLGFQLDPKDIDWNARHYGEIPARDNRSYNSRGPSDLYCHADVIADFVRLAKIGAQSEVFDTIELPALQAIMYRTGYDIMLTTSYERFLRDVAEDLPEHTEWLLFFFRCRGYPSLLDTDINPWSSLWTLITGNATRTERRSASADWARFRLKETSLYGLPRPLFDAVCHVRGRRFQINHKHWTSTL